LCFVLQSSEFAFCLFQILLPSIVSAGLLLTFFDDGFALSDVYIAGLAKLTDRLGLTDTDVQACVYYSAHFLYSVYIFFFFPKAQ
jgi:hypothetical protein